MKPSQTSKPKTKTSSPKAKKHEKTKVPQPQTHDAILSREEWLVAFTALPPDMLRALVQQFPTPIYVFKELGQNSQDSGARNILCLFRIENATLDGFDFIAEWRDDGCGMTREVLFNHYLALLHSSKDEQHDECVGRHGAGRLAVFSIPGLITQETFTMSSEPGSPGYLVRMQADGSGEVLECERETALESLVVGDSRRMKPHGTLVRIRYRLSGGEPEFAAETQKIVQLLHQELRFIRSRLTVTTVRYEEPKDGQGGTLVFGTEVINQPFGIPGRLAQTYPFELGDGRGKGVVSMGIRPDEKQALPDLGHLTLTCGGIPLERRNGTTWCRHDRNFNLDTFRVLIESYNWQPPLGRHRVQNNDFHQEVIPKIFEKIILQRYAVWLARMMADPHEQTTRGYRKNIATFFFDLLNESLIIGFPLPEDVMTMPLFPCFGYRRMAPNSWKQMAYSLRDLERAEHFYFTTREPDMADWRSLDDGPPGPDSGGMIVLGLYGCAYYAISFLESRFGARAERIHERFLVKEDTSAMSKAVNARIQETRLMQYVPSMHRSLKIGRFVRLGNGEVPDTNTRSQANKERGSIRLNSHHPDIQNMMKLIVSARTEDQFLGVHFLLREALLADGIDLGERQRRRALQAHAASRQGNKGMMSRHLGRSDRMLFDALFGHDNGDDAASPPDGNPLLQPLASI